MRASGEKRNELTLRKDVPFAREHLDFGCRFGCGSSIYERLEFVGVGRPRASLAHTAPIYVRVEAKAIQPPAELLRAWIARLDAFEAQLADDRLDELLVWRPLPRVLLMDGVPEAALRRDRPELLRAIARARAAYERMLGGVR